MNILSDIELGEVDRIINRRVGLTYSTTQRGMQYVVEKYIKARTGRIVKINALKGLDMQVLTFYPDAGLNELKKLDFAYTIAFEWFKNNRGVKK